MQSKSKDAAKTKRKKVPKKRKIPACKSGKLSRKSRLGKKMEITAMRQGVIPSKPESTWANYDASVRCTSAKLFAGQYYDAETDLHYNYFRTYDPSTGRYITSDPIGLDGGINTYLYAYANPTKFIDPTGEFGLGGAVAVVTGVVGSFICYGKGIEKCAEAFPQRKDMLHPDRRNFLKCAASVTGVIALGAGLVSDPIGSAAGAVGGAATSCNDDDNSCK